MQIEAAVLTGGTSRRMGQDKAWIRLRGPEQPSVLEMLLALLEGAFARVRILSGTSSPDPYAALGVDVQPDLRPGAGPLAGIHTALATAEKDAVLVVPCDMPFLTRSFLVGLSGLLSGYDAVVPRTGSFPVPVCALYARACLPAAEARLQRGELQAVSLLEDLSVHWVEGRQLAQLDPGGRALFNLNTPEDVEQAREILRREDGGS